MNIEEEDLATPVRRCGPRLGYVHVGESNRGDLSARTEQAR
jgi:D-psicose/D-tagatose/L-ribulose 3-epimerase